MNSFEFLNASRVLSFRTSEFSKFSEVFPDFCASEFSELLIFLNFSIF